VPAAAVIPAPIAYAKVAVVKKLVVGFRGGKDNEARKNSFAQAKGELRCFPVGHLVRGDFKGDEL